MLTILQMIFLIFTGLLAGILIGLSGTSGAAIMVSLMYILTNFSLHECIGSALMANAIASFTVFLTYRKFKNVDFSPCIWLALGSIPGSQIGAVVGKITPETQLGGMIGFGMLLTGILVWKKGMDREELIRKLKKVLKIEEKPSMKGIIGILIGILVGILSGLFGISGGMWFLIVFLLVFGLPLHKSVGGAIFMMSITASFAAFAHYMNENINPLAGLLVGVGAMISGSMSARMANRSTERRLIRIISLIVSILGVAMILLKIVIPYFWNTEVSSLIPSIL